MSAWILILLWTDQLFIFRAILMCWSAPSGANGQVIGNSICFVNIAIQIYERGNILFNSAFRVTEYLYFVFQHKTNLFQELISTHEYSISTLTELRNTLLCFICFNRLLCMLAHLALSYWMVNWLLATLRVHTSLPIVHWRNRLLSHFKWESLML